MTQENQMRKRLDEEEGRDNRTADDPPGNAVKATAPNNAYDEGAAKRARLLHD